MTLISSKLWAVGGGKGGVGKSFIASNLACGLAQKGYMVILVDADLAGANIHTLFGIRYPKYTLGDFLRKKVHNFTDILVPTPQANLHLICGASNLLELANPKFAQKQKLIRNISGLNADYIIIDIGAGANFNNLDFFNIADIGIIVASPTPTSMQNAYSFLKGAVHRRLLGIFPEKPIVKEKIFSILEGKDNVKNMVGLIESIQEIDKDASYEVIKTLIKNRYRLITNMATEKEGERVSKAMSGVAYQFLRMKLLHLGNIANDKGVELSIRKMKPLMLSGDTDISRSIRNIVDRIVAETDLSKEKSGPEKRSKRTATSISRGYSQANTHLCLSDEIVYKGKKLRIQTEDLGTEKAQILSIVYSGGRIFFSKKIDYKDILDKEDSKRIIYEKVNRQHRTMVAGINAGKLNQIFRENGNI